MVFARCGAAKSPNGALMIEVIHRETYALGKEDDARRGDMGLRNALRRVATAVATEASAIARHGEPRAAYLGARTFLAQGGGAMISSGRFAPRVAAHAGASRPVRSFAASADCEYPRFVP